MSTVIEFRNFSFKYTNQSQPTLKNINLIIKRGEKVLIAGASGSGKSTLGSCLNGIVPFSKSGGFQGELFINGLEPYETNIFEISKVVGTVLQDQDGQFVGLSVGEDISFIDENNMVSHDAMLNNTRMALEEVEMLKFMDCSPQELSGGQKQSVSLGGILRSSAEILLFDEPLANLDPYSGKLAMRLIADIRKKMDKTIIVIEHRIEDVLEQDFDKVVILDKGEIVAIGTPEELLKKDMFRKYGLREPLYVEALRYAGVDFLTQKIFPISEVASHENIERMKKWSDKELELSSSSSENILELKNIDFCYDEGREILKNINLELKKGEILALLGNNGAGKSTLCKVITGIEKQKKGNIYIDKMDISNLSIRRRGEMIGYVMQNPNHMITKDTLIDEVAFGLKLREVPNWKEQSEKVLKICELYGMREWPINALSYGQKKRLTIATILALNPKVLILDEPTAGQDHRTYKEFMSFIRDLTELGISIILITHDMHLVLEYADRAIILHNGEIIGEDKPSRLFSQREILEKAHLKETSLSELAELMQIEPLKLIDKFIYTENREGDNV